MSTNYKKRTLNVMTCIMSCCVVLMSSAAIAQTEVPVSIKTPDLVESKIGTLQFKDGYPIGETAAMIRDEIDYLHGVEAFKNSIQGVSMYAIYKGFKDLGLKENKDVLLFSRLMNANSLFLTGNADTVYYITFIDLSNGPIVFHAPPDALGIIDDMWFNWVTDFGIGGAERGQGGRYLLVGPGYDGLLPDGYLVRKSVTNRVIVLGRSFLADNDPAPTVAVIKDTMRIYPYTGGASGTTVASYLSGTAKKLAPLPSEIALPRYVEATGLAFNTIPPNDFGHYEMLNALVQMEPAEALDPEIAGHFEAIGIVKGKKFAPDARMKKILTSSVEIGNATARTLGMGAHPTKHFRYYKASSAWWTPLFEGGYDFLNPPPMINKDGSVKLFPNSGARKFHSRSAFFYTATGDTPLMCMRVTGIGSQYLLANLDSTGNLLDGAMTYKVVLPKDIPAARFWSFTVYDNQSRSMLQTPQLYPRAGSQSFPSPAAVPSADGTTTIYFSPNKPQGVEKGNWIQTDPKKGWFTILRLYSPLQPFFDKTWQPSEIELVK